MFGMTIVQVILILLWVSFTCLDGAGPQFTMFVGQELTGFIIGLILGDPMKGLSIGCTIHLMSLGVVGVAGTTVPDYSLANVITCIVAIQSNVDYTVGFTLGLPIGMLAMNLDVLIKILLP